MRQLRGVAGAMLLDLEAEEIVDGGKGFAIARRNHHSCSAVCRDIFIGDGGFQPLHHRGAGRHLIVDEHGNLKIARLELPRDVRKVMLDGLAARGVFWVVRADLDRSAGIAQKEMVSGLRGVEAHLGIAACDHLMVMRILALRKGRVGEHGGNKDERACTQDLFSVSSHNRLPFFFLSPG